MDLYINWLNVGVCPENVPKMFRKCSQMSEASSLASVASKLSAGASLLRPALGRPVSASLSNLGTVHFDFGPMCPPAQLQFNCIMKRNVKCLMSQLNVLSFQDYSPVDELEI